MSRYQTINGKMMQHMYQLELLRKGDSVRVIFHSSIHKNKSVECTISWSTEFTDSEILRDRDLLRWVHGRYGNVLELTQPDMLELPL